MLGWSPVLKGISVWVPEPAVNDKVPKQGVKPLKPDKSTLPVETCKRLLLIFRVPPVVVIAVTVWVGEAPRFKVPPIIVKVPAETLLVMVVVPLLCFKSGWVAPALGVKFWVVPELNSKVPVPGVKVDKPDKFKVVP